MGIGPVFAVPRLLERHGLKPDDIDLWELNEAFASQVLYCMDRIGIPHEKLNVDGGAISIGHPYGMSGARMTGAHSSRRTAAQGEARRRHDVRRRRHGRGRPVRIHPLNHATIAIARGSAETRRVVASPQSAQSMRRILYIHRGPSSFVLFASLVVNLFVCAGCADDRLASSKPAAPAVDPATQMAALEERIFDIVQDERHRINPDAKPLALDSELMAVARERSADMAAKKYVAHKGPDGETSAGLIMAEDEDFQGLLGENLAAEHFCGNRAWTSMCSPDGSSIPGSPARKIKKTCLSPTTIVAQSAQPSAATRST